MSQCGDKSIVMDIPPEVVIKGTIRPGSVYYFPSKKLTSKESHFYVVVNLDPFNEQLIILVLGSSKIDVVKQRNKSHSSKTLVIVTPQQYPLFSGNTIFDCNNSVFRYPINDLVQRLSSKRLECCIREMPLDIVKLLREGVLASTVIERNIKEQLTKKPLY